jgi:hypothetical protein
MTSIPDLIDSYLEEMRRREFLFKMPDPKMPKAMIDSSIPTDNDWVGWKPVASTVTDGDLDAFEKEIKYPLPQSFRTYLKYKHFYELSLPDLAVNLPRHVQGRTIAVLRDLVFDSFEPELLIGRRYIYFADFHDYGLLCFDANEVRSDNEYPVVYIDHENLEEVHSYASNFYDLLTGDSERGNRFIDYVNELYQ